MLNARGANDISKAVITREIRVETLTEKLYIPYTSSRRYFVRNTLSRYVLDRPNKNTNNQGNPYASSGASILALKYGVI